MRRSPTRFGLAAVLLALLACALPAMAEDVYVSNKPFKGPVAGSGSETFVGLDALAKALGAEVKSVDGRWFVSSDPAKAPDSPAGSVVVGDKVVPSRAGDDGAPLVRLKDAAEAMGAVVRVDKSMGTIDVNRPVARAGGASGPGGAVAAGPMAPIHLNARNPGAAVDIERNLVAGRTNIVMFYADF